MYENDDDDYSGTKGELYSPGGGPWGGYGTGIWSGIAAGGYIGGPPIGGPPIGGPPIGGPPIGAGVGNIAGCGVGTVRSKAGMAAASTNMCSCGQI